MRQPQTHKKRYHSLSRRIVLQFCLFTLVLSCIYSLISFVMMYTLEDRFIEKWMQREADHLAIEYAKTGSWPIPRKDVMQLHFSKQTFPIDIRQLAIEEPNRKEFYGADERHYHAMEVPGHPDVYLLAEVSNELYVRPIRKGIITFLVISGLVVSVIACIIAWLIGRKTARPLKDLAELVGALEPEKIPSKFAHAFPNNEVGILADTLETSLENLAQALEREKCFTRDASHELRTPLAVIKNAAELLSSSLSLSEHTVDKQVVSRIAESAEHMDKTVHTLLMLARAEHASVAKEDTALMPILEKSVLNHRALLEGKDVEVVLDDSCNTGLWVQSGMLSVLIDNLLSNAFQYTYTGEVSVKFEHGSLIVKDTGQGIEASISDKITEPAVKGSQSTGFGFGLSIVKRLCEHQGWLMKVTSHGGTTVSVSLI